MDKPRSETITYYSYEEVKEYMAEKYHLDKKIFENWIEESNPFDGQMLYFHIGDYIVYQKYDSVELLQWFIMIESDFGSFIILEYDKE